MSKILRFFITQQLYYTIGSKIAVITPIKLILGILMIFFSLFELLPSLKAIRFSKRHLFWGGLLSGFFGGLSGHQGALRSAFLVKTGISTETFVATNAVLGFIVDITRILTYFFFFLLVKPQSPIGQEQWPLVAAGTLAAFTGVLNWKTLYAKNQNFCDKNTDRNYAFYDCFGAWRRNYLVSERKRPFLPISTSIQPSMLRYL